MSNNETTRNTEWQWSTKKEQAALGFAEGKKWDDIAKMLGMSVSTLSAWRKVPEFRQRIEEHIDEIVDEARRILRRNAGKAAQKIVDIAEYGNHQHGVRLQAAKDILDRTGVKTPEQIELNADISHKGYVIVSPSDWDEPPKPD